MKSYVIVLLLVVGIMAGFYGGFKVGQNNVSASTTTTAKNPARTGNAPGGFGGGGQRAFGGACPSPAAPSPSAGSQAVARGTITNLSSSSMTIANTSCDVKVTFGNTVQVSKTVAGNTSDLKDNITVTIIGTHQADGSILATTIQIGSSTPSGLSNQATSQ